MGTKIVTTADEFHYTYCPKCREVGRLRPSFERAVRDRVIHDLPGKCEVRKVESQAMLGIKPGLSRGRAIRRSGDYVNGTD